MSDLSSPSFWPRADRRTATALPGLGVPPCAGSAHLVKTLRASAEPAARPLMSAQGRGRPGSGVALALILAVPFWVCFLVVLWISWPVLRAAGAALADILRVVAL